VKRLSDKRALTVSAGVGRAAFFNCALSFYLGIAGALKLAVRWTARPVFFGI